MFSAVYGTLTAVVLRSMLGLCSDKICGTMTNYDDGDDDRNEDRNDDNNAASGSRSDSLIFDPITTTRSSGTSVAHYISTILRMRHKLLYAKFGVLDWSRCHMKKTIPSSINNRIDYIFNIYN